MKKTYINPEMVVVPFIPRNPLLVNSVRGLEGVNRGSGDFEGGYVDVKEVKSDIWDNEW